MLGGVSGPREALEAPPIIVALFERLEAIRRGEVEKGLARLPDASSETRAAIEEFSSAIVKQVLEAPVAKLRESSRNGDGAWPSLVATLFGLTDSREGAGSALTGAGPGGAAS